ncbi:hypothetical protein [Comamonas thiooxydans]|uniref:hypothetical protein n=1 Tax=Comamonas thiooxydans TaxID=363952 RepID=UPI000B41089F|nr:hypothetical protein [Comamonas thiooxydans]
MNEFFFYGLIGVGVVLVLMVVPGTKVLGEALLKLLIDFIAELLKHKSSFVVWALKTLVSDHYRIIQHAFTSRDTLDPTQRIRRKQMGYED